MKGLEYDNTFMKDDDELFGDIGEKTAEVNATPVVIHVNTPERKPTQYNNLLAMVKENVERLFDEALSSVNKESESRKEVSIQPTN